MENLSFVMGNMYSNALSAPPTGQSVWPKQLCPSFAPRRAIMAGGIKECWYCKFADFHLSEPIALEVGICCFPQIQVR